MSRAVILLKSPPRVLATDAYVQQFNAAGYTPYFIEVLDSVFSNVQALENILRSGPGHSSGFVGVAITSSRAADAWIQALSMVANPGDWSDTPFYVVGESTRRVLMRMTTLQPSKFSDSLIFGATETGSSESLAKFILDDLSSRRTGGKLLYLTGDKNKDTFRRILTANGVEIEELMVYETRAASDLGERIASIAKEIVNAHGRNKLLWLIFFAPSSSDFALPFLRQYFRFSQAYSPDSSQDVTSTAKLGAIGSTTATFLRSERHLQVDAVSAKPSAEQLVASICKSDEITDQRLESLYTWHRYFPYTEL